MIQIYAYTCLLSALSLVEMKPLYINGRVGENVTIKCSDWDAWTNVTDNVKYFCSSPCTKDHHIIVKAAYGDTKSKNRLKLQNKGKSLFVTFMNLQKSDSKTYFCGVERSGYDSLIKVILNIKEGSVAYLVIGVIAIITVLMFLLKLMSKMMKQQLRSSTEAGEMSQVSELDDQLRGHDGVERLTVVNEQHSHIQVPLVQVEGRVDGSVTYLVIGVIAIITVLMFLLKLMSKMMKQQLKVVSSADTRHEDTQEDAEYDEIRPEDQPDSDVLYANCSHHQVTELSARFLVNRGACTESRLTYDSAQLPKEEVEPTGQCESTQSERNQDDSLYSLAQLPQES
ncbi:uncharacterized protein PEZ65_003718 [Lycodopsis pacificus]